MRLHQRDIKRYVLLSLHKIDEKRHDADGEHQQERYAIDAERSHDSPVVEGQSDARPPSASP